MAHSLAGRDMASMPAICSGHRDCGGGSMQLYCTQKATLLGRTEFDREPKSVR